MPLCPARRGAPEGEINAGHHGAATGIIGHPRRVVNRSPAPPRAEPHNRGVIEVAAALPWLVPASAVAFLVSILASGAVGRALAVRRSIAWLLLFSFGVILASTLSPLDGGGLVPPGGLRTCDLSRLSPASFSDARYGQDVAINILMFLPLGLPIGIAPMSRGKAAAVFGAIALPFAIETTQLVVVPLDRACQGADVVDNLTGLGIGLVAGAVLVRVVPKLRRPAAATG